MGMMGWSNPKTAMVYVKKSRMTSLSMSLYLANVQRSNCPDPFPRSPLEKRQAVKQVQVSKSIVSKGPLSCLGLPLGEPELKVEDPEDDLATQDLIDDFEVEESL